MFSKNLIIFITAILSMISIVNGQSTFYKEIGDSAFYRGVTVEQTIDSGFIVTGYVKKDSSNNEDLLIIKTDKSGNMLWEKVYGGKGSDNGWAIRQLPSGGYIVVGYADSFGSGKMDVYLLRMDNNGDTLWSKTYGGEWDEYGWDIRVTSDNGYIIASQTDTKGAGEVDALLIKLDSSGNEIWSNTYGSDKTDRVFSVRETSDGGYVATGITYSYGAIDRNAYLIKTDSNGELEWYKSFGGDAYDVGHNVTVAHDGGYLITGYGESFSKHGKRDVYLIKTDSKGEKEWIKVHGTPENDRAMKGETTSDGGYISVGFTQGTGAKWLEWDMYLLKTDSDGELLWTKNFGDDHNVDFGYTVKETFDKGFIAVGHTHDFEGRISKVLLIKTDKDGNYKE